MGETGSSGRFRLLAWRQGQPWALGAQPAQAYRKPPPTPLWTSAGGGGRSAFTLCLERPDPSPRKPGGVQVPPAGAPQLGPQAPLVGAVRTWAFTCPLPAGTHPGPGIEALEQVGEGP